MTLPPKIQIPGYTIQSSLGAGGMAQVYLAVQHSLNRQVALKVMTLADPELHERFLREGRMVARLDHRHIITVHDVGEFQGCYYMAMEYARGGTLEARIKRGLTVEQALTILSQAAMALDHAHRQELVHRDIKPANILFRADDTVVVSDFGIAKDYHQNQQLTQTGWALGTPSYMSPEQARGESVDSRSDLYSLGVMFYEMLTGSRPYRAPDRIALMLMHREQPIPRLPDALARYQGIVDRLMAKHPEQRFATAAELLAELSQTHDVSEPPARREATMRDGEWRARVEPDAARGAGYAVLVLEGLVLPPREVFCSIKRVGFGDDDLGPDGWRNGEHWFEPSLIETAPDRESRLVLGPEIVQHLENGNYRLGLKAPGLDPPRERGLNWRDIPQPPNLPQASRPLRRGRGKMGEVAPPPGAGAAKTVLATDLPPVVEPAPPVAEPAPPVAEPAPPVVKPVPPVVEPVPPVVEPVPPVIKLKVLVALVLGILVAAGVGGYWWWSSQPDEPIRPLAVKPVEAPLAVKPVEPPPATGTPSFTLQDARQKLREGLTPDQMYALAQQFQARPDGLEGALLLYGQAAEQNHAAAALKLAEMYDPTRNEPTPLPRRRAARAYEWYRKAAAGGVAEAGQRLEALRAWTEREAARGNAEAQALLQDWR